MASSLERRLWVACARYLSLHLPLLAFALSGTAAGGLIAAHFDAALMLFTVAFLLSICAAIWVLRGKEIMTRNSGASIHEKVCLRGLRLHLWRSRGMAHGGHPVRHPVGEEVPPVWQCPDCGMSKSRWWKSRARRSVRNGASFASAQQRHDCNPLPIGEPVMKDLRRWSSVRRTDCGASSSRTGGAHGDRADQLRSGLSFSAQRQPSDIHFLAQRRGLSAHRVTVTRRKASVKL